MLKKTNSKYILINILVLTAILRFFNFNYPDKFVFDEVYHAFTAQEYSKGNIEAWEWWTTPPPNVAFEWTHPPLAKEIMAASMILTNSHQSWAWRLPGVLLGIFSVYLVYLIGNKLFKNEAASLISAFVFSIDGLNFVQSRIGMNDIYFVTFMLLSIYFFLSKNFLLSAVVLGLSLASKWAALYTYIIYLPFLLQQKYFKQLFVFLIIPPLIYLFTYTPFFIMGHSSDQFIELHKQMWWYHTGLKASHDYSSPAWSWPLNLYPVWYFVDYQDNSIANIFASGNPILFLFGSIYIIFTIWEVIKNRSISLFMVILGFLAFWLPWLASPRIMFLYHFSASVPFLCLAFGYQLNKEIDIRKGKLTVGLILLLITLTFMLIYPFLVGIHLPQKVIAGFFFINLAKNPFSN